MKTPLLILTTLLAVSLLYSCDPNRVYEKYLSLEDARWPRDKKAAFEVEINDTISRYDLYVNFRHAGNYNYRNLYLFTEIIGPRNLSAVDTLQMILADNRGNWLGKGIGDLYDYTFLFKKNISFPAAGNYVFKIEQAMRDEELKNVTDIGLRIEKTDAQ